MSDSKLHDALREDRGLFEHVWREHLEGCAGCGECPMCVEDKRYGLLCELDEGDGELYVVSLGDSPCDAFADALEDTAAYWRAQDSLEAADAAFDAARDGHL